MQTESWMWNWFAATCVRVTRGKNPISSASKNCRIFNSKWRRFVPNFLGVIETSWEKYEDSWNISIYFAHPWPNLHQRSEAASRQQQPPTTLHLIFRRVYSLQRHSSVHIRVSVWSGWWMLRLKYISALRILFCPDIVLIAGSASHISRWSLLLSASCWHLHFINIITCYHSKMSSPVLVH